MVEAGLIEAWCSAMEWQRRLFPGVPVEFATEGWQLFVTMGFARNRENLYVVVTLFPADQERTELNGPRIESKNCAVCSVPVSAAYSVQGISLGFLHEEIENGIY
jgi:hypothetical protein